jgi:hypothetical protein
MWNVLSAVSEPHPGARSHARRRIYRWRRWLRLTRAGRALALARRSRLTPARLARHAHAASTPDPSHASEWTHLRTLLERLDLLDAGFAVDLAAGDGVTSSCTLPLFRDHGWWGLAIEGDPTRFALLEHAYLGLARVTPRRAWVSPDGSARLLRELAVPRDFALLNIDIDSYDLDVAAAILAEFRPIVVDLEINEKIPPPVRFAVRYGTHFRWDEGHCYGCSLAAACDVVGAMGYRLEGLEYNNAFFVREDVAARFGGRIQSGLPGASGSRRSLPVERGNGGPSRVRPPNGHRAARAAVRRPQSGDST